MIKQLLILTVLTANSIALSNADTVVEIDTPNPGDTSTTITYTTGTVTTTNNLISQTWNDGSWTGTQFPDSSDLSENIFVTGKHEKYLETTVSSTDLMTEDEIKRGFTSNFGVQARWWNTQESTFTMYQTAADNLGNSTKQTTTFEDTTDHNYQFNPYANTLIVAPNENLTHGTLTAGFSFDIKGSATYNGGHVGVDLRKPTLTIDYETLTQTSVTTIEYCYEKNPPTCPGQEEIDAVEDIVDSINVDNIVEDIFINEIDTYIPETIVYIPEEVEIDEIDYYEIPPITFEVAYVPDVETIIVIDTPDVETNIDMNMPDIPTDEYFDVGMPEDVEMFDTETMDTNDLVEMFTNEPEFKGEPNADFTEDVMGTGPEIELTENSSPVSSEEEYIEMVEEKPLQEIAMEEEPINEPEPENQTEVEEQPNSEEPIANKPEPEPDNPQQEETVEESVEAEVKPEPEPAMEEDIETEVVEEKPEIKIDVAKIEKTIKAQVTNKLQQISATLDVVSEVLSREMKAQEPDMSSYIALNAAMIDNRQLPSGNLAFFNQISLESYSKTIYNDPTKLITMIGVDPVIVHRQKMNVARNNTNEAYYKLKALLEAQNVQ
tara:strand:- start:2851 stop:4665 length:1815 start_codon:yes stop_codon:yes gene_type:complete